MSYWRVILSHDGTHAAPQAYQVYLNDVHKLFHIEGNTENVSTWRFTQAGDDTQIKDQYVCDIGRSITFATHVSQLRVAALSRAQLEPYSLTHNRIKRWCFGC